MHQQTRCHSDQTCNPQVQPDAREKCGCRTAKGRTQRTTNDE
jgi:hypothetical protein